MKALVVITILSLPGFSALPAPLPAPPAFPAPPALENVLERELEIPHRIRATISGRCDAACIRIQIAGHTDFRIGIRQVHGVEKVDGFHAELDGGVALLPVPREPLEEPATRSTQSPPDLARWVTLLEAPDRQPPKRLLIHLRPSSTVGQSDGLARATSAR